MIGKVDALSAGYGDANHSGLFELRQFYRMLTFAWDLFILAINVPLDCSLKGCMPEASHADNFQSKASFNSDMVP